LGTSLHPHIASLQPAPCLLPPPSPQSDSPVPIHDSYCCLHLFLFQKQRITPTWNTFLFSHRISCSAFDLLSLSYKNSDNLWPEKITYSVFRC
jgi:hypothetical protein